MDFAGTQGEVDAIKRAHAGEALHQPAYLEQGFVAGIAFRHGKALPPAARGSAGVRRNEEGGQAPYGGRTRPPLST